MNLDRSYDVIVVGGGHAGSEAAAAAGRIGARTLLITPDLARVGQMSCNPAIGGIAKGVVAREVDALGGIMGRATDAARIQFRMLNRSKGPAVWSPRAQCDRGLYPRGVRKALDEVAGLLLYQDMVTGLLMEEGRACGVRTRVGGEFRARAVVVTAGTFLRGRIHIGGDASVGAGRAGEAPSVELAEELESLQDRYAAPHRRSERGLLSYREAGRRFPGLPFFLLCEGEHSGAAALLDHMDRTWAS